MADHCEDEQLENKAQEPAHHTDESGGINDSSIQVDEKAGPAIALTDMPDEEESSDIYRRIEDVAEQLDNLESSPADENSTHTTPHKKIRLTEADYADMQATENELELTGNHAESGRNETADSMPESVSGSEEPINLQAAAGETHADKAEVPAANENPEALDMPTHPPVPQPRTGMAITLGLLGIVGASGALWMNFMLSDRVGQLETQLSSRQEATAIPAQGEEITVLKQRIAKLETTVSSLMAVESTPGEAPTPRITHSDSPLMSDTKTPSGKQQDAWVINLISLNNGAAADHELKRLQQLGIHAESVQAEVQGKTWYRIRVPGFTSAGEATRQRRILANRLGIHDTWIGKR